MTRHHRHFPEGASAMMRIMTILGAGLIGLIHPTASHAGPFDFMFSFTGTIPPSSVAGTVSGEIFGLTDNATGPASNVVVDGYPAELGLPSPPLTIFSFISENSFTVSNNQITAVDYSASDSSDIIQLNLNVSSHNVLATSTNGLLIGNENGFAGATYSLVQPIPEPSSVTPLATGLLFAALWPLRRRLRRRGRGCATAGWACRRRGPGTPASTSPGRAAA